MILALKWMIVALFFAAWLGIMGYSAKLIFMPTPARDDERKIRTAFESNGCKVLRIDPQRKRFTFPRGQGTRTYTVLVKPLRGRQIKRQVEFAGHDGQPTILY